MASIFEHLKCIKRDGTKVDFDLRKIYNAITKANEEKGVAYSDSTINSITASIGSYIVGLRKDEIDVESIQDIVVQHLMEKLPKIAEEYITYRYKRSLARNKDITIINKYKSRVECKEVENANANVDEWSFSGREKEAASDVSKAIALEFGGLSPKIANAHKDMLVYQHDLEKAIYGIHNCLFTDIRHTIEHGFSTRNGDVRPPSTYATAAQLVPVHFQLGSLCQFGGIASMHLDYDLAPTVKKSFLKHFRQGLHYIEDRPWDTYIDVAFPKGMDVNMNDNKYKDHPLVYKYAMNMLDGEMKQSTEALYHNLNTLESRSGSQLPFTSINIGRDTSLEGRLVTKSILEASLNGIGKNHRTSIFPISVFQYKKGVNANEDDPNYDLFDLAIESLSKRIYPNFINCDFSEAHEDPNDIDTMFATMGCRTMVGYDVNGLGYTRQGRGNNVPNTIILPKLGIEYGICLGKRETPDLDGFWNAFEDALKLAETGLLERYAIMKRQSPKAAPFMYINETIKGAEKCTDTVEESLKHNSLAIGYIGIAEMCTALFGTNHVHSEEAYNFALKVVERINTFAKEASQRHSLNFSCYATPAENLCKTAVNYLRNQYGTIPGVTDRAYLTNSHHVPVWEEVSIFKKLELEAPFCKYATGGCITYVELDSMFINNKEAIKKIIHYAFDTLDIPYLAFNFPIDDCNTCGFSGEISEDTCPECGSSNIVRLRRVTGYITTDYRYFNSGKIAEVNDRVKHSLIKANAVVESEIQK